MWVKNYELWIMNVSTVFEIMILILNWTEKFIIHNSSFYNYWLLFFNRTENSSLIIQHSSFNIQYSSFNTPAVVRDSRNTEIHLLSPIWTFQKIVIISTISFSIFNKVYLIDSICRLPRASFLFCFSKKEKKPAKR